MEGAAVSREVCEEKHRSIADNLKRIEEETKANTQSCQDIREIMAHQTEILDRISKVMEGLEGRVDAIEKKPAIRWEAAVGQAISLIIAAVFGAVAGKIF